MVGIVFSSSFQIPDVNSGFIRHIVAQIR